MNQSKVQILNEICMANSLEESLILFNLHFDSLRGCKIVFGAKDGAMPGFSTNHNFSDGSVVRSLFSTDSVFVLDQETVNDMRSGPATYPIDYSISMDTQAISYLEPYIIGNKSRLPGDFEEIFKFISRKDVQVDPMPYVLENLENLLEPKKAERIFEKIKAYEVLRTIDAEALEKLGIVQSTLSNAELMKSAQGLIASLYQDLCQPSIIKQVEFNFNFSYWHLLAMISIQLSEPKSTTEAKLYKLIGMCDSELATISFREITIARSYFDRGQGLKFFGKVQKKRDDLFAIVRGMAWDMWHIKQMELNLTTRPRVGARYFFPSFLTCDKRLVEIIDLYPLKAFAYDQNDPTPIPFYGSNWIESLSSSEEFGQEIGIKYFTDSARLSRDIRRDEAKRKMNSMVSKLEARVAEIACISMRELVDF